jgi:hypothetical protein
MTGEEWRVSERDQPWVTNDVSQSNRKNLSDVILLWKLLNTDQLRNKAAMVAFI